MDLLIVLKITGIFSGKYLRAYNNGFMWFICLYYSPHLFCCFVLLPVTFFNKIKGQYRSRKDRACKIFLLFFYLIPCHLIRWLKPLYYLSGGRSVFKLPINNQLLFKPMDVWTLCNNLSEHILAWILFWPFLIFESIFLCQYEPKHGVAAE